METGKAEVSIALPWSNTAQLVTLFAL